jgi:hypothetical protein
MVERAWSSERARQSKATWAMIGMMRDPAFNKKS